MIQHVLHDCIRLLIPLRAVFRHHVLAIHGEIALQFSVFINTVPGKRRDLAVLDGHIHLILVSVVIEFRGFIGICTVIPASRCFLCLCCLFFRGFASCFSKRLFHRFNDCIAAECGA